MSGTALRRGGNCLFFACLCPYPTHLGFVPLESSEVICVPCPPTYHVLLLQRHHTTDIQMYAMQPAAYCLPVRVTEHISLLLEPIYKFIYRLTEKFCHNCSTHPNPLVCQIGNYTLSDLHTQYRKYIHKRTEHLLL